MDSNNRVALVTGASSGLGEAIARRLGASGWTVGLLARRHDRLDRLAAELGRDHARATVLAGDVSDSAFAAAAVEELVAKAGRLDLLVNNAGALTPSSSEPVSDDDFDAVFALNVRALYRLSYLALPHLERTRGAIVNIGSTAVARNMPFDLPYMASKAAVESLSRGMAKVWGPKGIRVNTVSPGVIATEAMTAGRGLSPDEAAVQFRELAATLQPLPREGRPEDIAGAVAYLASEGFITGATLHVDGGVALGG